MAEPKPLFTEEEHAALRSGYEEVCDQFEITDPFHRSVMLAYGDALGTLKRLSFEAREVSYRALELKMPAPFNAGRMKMRTYRQQYEEARKQVFACKFIMEAAGGISKESLETVLTHFSDIAYSDTDVRRFDREMEGPMKKFFQTAYADLRKHDVAPMYRPETAQGEPVSFTRRRFVKGLAPVAGAMMIGGVVGSGVEAVVRQKDAEPSAKGAALGASAGYVVQMVRAMTPGHPLSHGELKGVIRALREQYIAFSRYELAEIQKEVLASEKEVVGAITELGSVLEGQTAHWERYVPEGRADQQPQHAHTWLRDVVLNAVTPLTYLENEHTSLTHAAQITGQVAQRLQTAPVSLDAVEKAAAAQSAPRVAKTIAHLRQELSRLQQALASYGERAQLMNERGFSRSAD